MSGWLDLLRKSDDFWINTYKGKKFNLIDPDPSAIDIEDIAHSLSLVCRFNGMCREHYSVAQHSVLCCGWGDQTVAKELLLHDATEAYLGDCVRPLKRYLYEYQDIEKQLEDAIAKKFNLKQDENTHRLVKETDNKMLFTEARDLMNGGPKALNWVGQVEPFEGRIEPWLIKGAESAFLQAYFQIA